MKVNDITTSYEKQLNSIVTATTKHMFTWLNANNIKFTKSHEYLNSYNEQAITFQYNRRLSVIQLEKIRREVFSIVRKIDTDYIIKLNNPPDDDYWGAYYTVGSDVRPKILIEGGPYELILYYILSIKT